MRIFLGVVVVVLLAAFGLRAESPKPADVREYHVLSTLDLLALAQDRALGASDPAGLQVELLLVPTRVADIGGRDFLHDDITGLTCAPPRAALSRVGQPGDDFLVVRGVMSRPDAAGVREIIGCRVVGWDGVVWEETLAAESAKQAALYRAGRL